MNIYSQSIRLSELADMIHRCDHLRVKKIEQCYADRKSEHFKQADKYQRVGERLRRAFKNEVAKLNELTQKL